MAVSYKKLWHILVDRNMKKKELEEKRLKYKYCVAEFKKTADFGCEIKSVKVKMSADCFYHFYLNGEMLSIGPASSDGDFLCRRLAPKHYANEFEKDIMNSFKLQKIR